MTCRIHSTAASGAGAAAFGFVPVQPERLALAGIAAVVRHEALAGDEIEPSVAVQIHERRGVALRPGVVDRCAASTAVVALLEPEHAVVVAGRGDRRRCVRRR